jgi:RND superfamily putative drug exporter
VIQLAHLSIRRPARALIAWVALAAALAVVGLGIVSSLSPSMTTVAGTQSSRAQHLSDSRFGPGVLVPILLEGPAKSLDRQGPALVRALARRSDTRVLSAWDSGQTGAELRPRPAAAMVVASVARTERTMVETTQAEIERTVREHVRAPVRPAVTGQPAIDRALRDEAIDVSRTRMAWTVPILFLALLMLLRAPLVALALTLLGAGTAFSSFGAMTLLGKVMDVDATAVTLASVTGLALGVGYGLLFYRRWRAEVVADVGHADAARAAATAVDTTGRAVLIGGSALVVSLVLATLIAPTEILASLGIGVLLCAALGVGAAVVVMPAALVLLAHRAHAFSFAAPAPALGAWERAVGGGGVVVRHAVTVGAAATAMLGALALPLLALDTGPPSVKFLPAGNAARASFERVAKVMGPGWPTPFNIVVVSRDRPITDKALLGRLDAFQDELARDARIGSVVGPGEFAATSRDLNTLPKQLKSSSKLLKTGKKDLGRLESGLGRAGAGVGELRAGLEEAAGGAGKLQGGSGEAQSGAGRLRAGLDTARTGAKKISAGLTQALDAARKLRDGAGTALAGSKQVTGGLGQAVAPVKTGAPIVRQMAADVTASATAVKGSQATAQVLAGQLDEAAAALAALPASPQKTAAAGALGSARDAAGGLTSSLGSTGTALTAAAGVAGAFSTQVDQLASGLAQLYAGSAALQKGIGQLHDGNARLADGIDQLAGGGGQLTTGVTALRDGAAELETGLGQLTGGAGQLAGGLSAGAGPSGELVAGLGKAESSVAKFRANLPSPKDLERLQRESPGLFDSGYFVLAAIAGAGSPERNQASFAVNLARGGDAGQITVIPRFASETAATQRLGEDLQTRADAFARATGTEAAVGGPAGSLGDFRSETASRIWPVVIGLSLAVSLLMMAMLRTVVLPLVAVAFDLLTCSATFGVLALLFDGADPLLGGPGYIDPMNIIGIFAVVFGVTMVYEVHLLQRTREAFLATGDAHGALRHGLRETAAAGTGAAAAMVAALVPFAGTQLVTVREFVIGMGVAILLDALIVRPVLLPAAVELLGRWSWWPSSRFAPGASIKRSAGTTAPDQRVPV